MCQFIVVLHGGGSSAVMVVHGGCSWQCSMGV